MSLCYRPLDEAMVKSIAADWAPLVAALIDTAPSAHMSAHEMAAVGGRVLLAHPQIANAIIAAGYDSSIEEAEKLSEFTRFMRLIAVVRATREHLGTPRLQELVFAELTPYSATLNGQRH